MKIKEYDTNELLMTATMLPENIKRNYTGAV